MNINDVDEENSLDKNILDDDGRNIYKKKSSEKTVEERIKTSRTLKIKNNKWNQVDYTEDFTTEKITIDPNCYHSSSSYVNVEFEKKYQEIIENSKYKEMLLGNEKTTVTYQIINELILYCYTRMKQDYSLVDVYVETCEYCGIGFFTMWKRLSSYLQMKIIDELKETNRLSKEYIYTNTKLWN